MVAERAIDPAAATRHGVQTAFGRGRDPVFLGGCSLAYACTDYPAIWNKPASFSARAASTRYAGRSARVHVRSVGPAEFADSDFFIYDYCLSWPSPE